VIAPVVLAVKDSGKVSNGKVSTRENPACLSGMQAAELLSHKEQEVAFRKT